MPKSGQGSKRRSTGASRSDLDDGGFIMVALLIGMAVAAVWMSAALPSWRQQVMREREAELIFRGESYARAIYLYRQKTGQFPRNIDNLVSQHYLRKKYKDPITGKDFLPVVAAAGLAPGPGGGASFQSGPQAGGIIGVRSTSNDTSIRIYANQQTYSQWPFDWTLEAQRSGAAPPGAGLGGRGGGRPGGPGRGGVGTGRGGPRGPGEDQPIAPGRGRGFPPPGTGRGSAPGAGTGFGGPGFGGGAGPGSGGGRGR